MSKTVKLPVGSTVPIEEHQFPYLGQQLTLLNNLQETIHMLQRQMDQHFANVQNTVREMQPTLKPYNFEIDLRQGVFIVSGDNYTEETDTSWGESPQGEEYSYKSTEQG